MSRDGPDADINAADNFGWTPLHEAINAANRRTSKSAEGAAECVRLLLGHSCAGGKSVDILAKAGEEGVTPMHEAVQNDAVDIVRTFFDAVKIGKSSGRFSPSVVAELFRCQTRDGLTLKEMTMSAEMNDVLASAFKNLSLNKGPITAVTPLKPPFAAFSSLNFASTGLVSNILRKYTSLFSLHFTKEDLKLKREDERRFAAGWRVTGREDLVSFALDRTDRVAVTDLRSFNELLTFDVKSSVVPRSRSMVLCLAQR